MGKHTCTLKIEEGHVVTSWSQGSFNIRVGDIIHFKSPDGTVILEFDEDCPFLRRELKGEVYFQSAGNGLTFRVERLNKKFVFKCSIKKPTGEVVGWTDAGGDEIPRTGGSG